LRARKLPELEDDSKASEFVEGGVFGGRRRRCFIVLIVVIGVVFSWFCFNGLEG
jgi:hypothetical protein